MWGEGTRYEFLPGPHVSPFRGRPSAGAPGGENASPAQRGPRREIRLSVAYFLREHSLRIKRLAGEPAELIYK